MVLATCKETAEMMVVRVSPGAELSGNAVNVNDRECDMVGSGRQAVWQ